ncbi:MAG: hypothetical protein C0612_12250, partial [Desulfobulbaceae bacterium]
KCSAEICFHKKRDLSASGNKSCVKLVARSEKKWGRGLCLKLESYACNHKSMQPSEEPARQLF